MIDNNYRFRTAAPMGLKHRISPQSAWPLRAADGRTFAERKADAARTNTK